MSGQIIDHSFYVKRFGGIKMDNINYSVYVHTGPTGKKYVGMTCQKPNDRFGKNGHGYSKQPQFYDDILKYGWDKFKHNILKSGLTKKEAEYWERYYIKKYNANNFLYGYNCTSGGLKNIILNKETVMKISKKHIGIPRPPEVIDALRKRMKECTGEKNPFYGKQHTEDAKRLIGEASKKRMNSGNYKCAFLENPYYKGKFGIEHNRSIQCRCVETNIEYGSILEAMRETGVDSTSISRCCRGKQKTAGGYHWVYVTIR